jgi:type II secretory pathway component GspD/PulD (secretin)
MLRLLLPAVLALLAAAAPAEPSLDAKVTVRVKDAPLSDFLDALSAQTKLDFIVAEGLERVRVTAFLKDVTARDALQVLLLKGLTYRRVGKSGPYLVAPRSQRAGKRVTRVYTLSNAPVSDDGGAAAAIQGK